uniref:Calponin-homology (CH) domain-containing protein n=1 Tax=Poecilia formosa TaxID=48698 RepID=A0A096LSA8_POEFO
LPHPPPLPHHPPPSPLHPHHHQQQQQQHHHHGGVGAVTALQNHDCPSGPHWSPGARSLDRALEDAVSSGILNLSGRKLREYPGINYDLTDTTQADLSKNHLAEIPPEVCLFAPLESLNLYHNCIKSIPEAIINLQMLTYLDISRNLLSVLPKYLFNLPLKVLLVSNNKLVSIPEEIGKAKELMELDVSCNEIQVLPAQVGRLQALRELNIRKNCLHMLPEELADLPLIRLDFSCNKITEIPPAFRKLRQLEYIILDNNPMQSPPAQICLKGKVHIFKYLNIQACRTDKKPDTLDLPTLSKRCLPQPLTDSKNHGPDSGIGSDNGDKRLSTTEPSDDDTVSLHSQVSETARADALSLLSKMDSCKGYPKKKEIEKFCCPDPHAVLLWDGTTSVSDKDQLAEEEDDLHRFFVNLHFYSLPCSSLYWKISKHAHRNTAGLHVTLAKECLLAAVVSELLEAADFIQHSDPKHMSKSVTQSEDVNQYARHGMADLMQCHLSVLDGRIFYYTISKCEIQTIKTMCSEGSHPFKNALRRFNSQTSAPVQRQTSSPSSIEPTSAFTRGTRQDISSTDPSFTMRRKMEHLREEMEQIGLLRQNIESRLKVLLPDDVGAALMDGVVLCHLANHICPRSVASIHVPSPAVPKLSMAKCRRNVENFLEACKKLGVSQDKLCLPHHILEERGLVRVGVTVQALLDLPTPKSTHLSSV